MPIQGCRIAVYIDAAHQVRAGVPLAGELIFLAEGSKPEQVKIKLKPLPVSAFGQALAWTLGIGVPALLTFLLGLSGQRIKTRSDAEDNFFNFRFSNHAKIKKFFTEYYPTLLKEREDFPGNVYEKLIEQALFEPVPPHYAKPILRSLKKNDAQGFEKALKRAFPEFMETS